MAGIVLSLNIHPVVRKIAKVTLYRAYYLLLPMEGQQSESKGISKLRNSVLSDCVSAEKKQSLS